MTEEGRLMGMSWDETDYSPVPLAPAGTYFGSITGVKLNVDKFNLQIKVALSGNGGVMSDGETQLDGSTMNFLLFLPKPEDTTERTASGKQTKKEWKVNTLLELGEVMGFDTSSRGIQEAAASQSWVGRDVVVETAIEDFQGSKQDKIKSMRPKPTS